MTLLYATNMRVTAIKAGADGFFDGPGDDVYMNLRDASSVTVPDYGFVTKTSGHLNSPNEWFDGDKGYVSQLLQPGGSLAGSAFVGQDSISFQIWDSDKNFFDMNDDLLLSTQYKANGNEPLVGQSPFYFINFSNQSGSQYKFEYNINKFSTTGKVASEKGGVMNGRNTDGTMVGLQGKDTILGNDGDDLILGGGNDDILNGGNGNDVIFGGKGNDQLIGGKGNDVFVLARDNGFDTVKDFRQGDHIGLANGLEYKDLSFAKVTNGTLVKAGNEQLALLQGVTPNQLSASSFIQTDLASINSLVQANLAAIRAS